MYNFNIVITELCNANCSHCYMNKSNKKEKKTMSRNDIDIFVEKLPKQTKRVVLTGGEIFVVKDLLFYAISKIHNKNPKIEIGLETNGIYFYLDLVRAKKELIELKSLGVTFIRFSDDEFHASGGVDLTKVRKLKELENDRTPTLQYLVQEKAVAIGKAKNLNPEKIAVANCMNNKKTETNPYFFIDVNGDVFICTWKCIPAIGNIFNDKFESITKNLESKFNNMILTGKIEQAISFKYGHNEENISFAKQYGQCRLCEKYFKER